jgi:hypothetical protein
LAVSAGSPLTASLVEKQRSASVILSGPIVGLIALSCAATPATCGVAIEVPEMVLVAVSELLQAAVIDLPGACMSTHRP